MARACEIGELSCWVKALSTFVCFLALFEHKARSATVYSQVWLERERSPAHISTSIFLLLECCVTLAAPGAPWKGTAGIQSGTKSRKIPRWWAMPRRILRRRRTRKWRRTWRHAGVAGSRCPCGTRATDHRLTQTRLQPPQYLLAGC